MVSIYGSVTVMGYWNDDLNCNLQCEGLILQNILGCINQSILLSSLTRNAGPGQHCQSSYLKIIVHFIQVGIKSSIQHYLILEILFLKYSYVI